ncbi:bifunctional folylpolyglutamate synthase/dihydrofolate synthase [Acetobacter sp.]|jgi:dihydrofolate synthase/folylpolyglutamate synthase|uniref:bifunctional folylpolyglutamate synthase/dihydrofolate synthase n=1 Tax=Acetobacter sp. TaxID=440 RepID=UPI0025C360BD|nr:folylpolyglutamate synthase/dihydrofolate synthase family protein [Acetobacter sp.]MCH4091732.1 bifunctional folylpolyglutamate synthase/dihydrofolate synthase [Acetobacter sp.]MCI1300411.1 bifunctional folylpolyglutamate synthase/dihydrofolate synthase [Acetobacter sp.]MCI1316770.1 bifunctional folylpolyglutamate synthase/dihydrofolate synthase [Acetobacter sp.]
MTDTPSPRQPALGAEFTGRTGTVLERLNRLYPALIDLSLGRLEALLGRLGHPERHLPPVIHVAGTNGKGSTCANLRAIGETAGWRVHVMTSPHLVDVTERFRVAGQLVSEEELVATLEEIERVNDGEPITVFEVLTAAGFLLFSRHPAELAIIEVGLGGRFDATNVLTRPAACAITAISMDHEAFLGSTLAAIAGEKAGIIKPSAPVVTGRQPQAVRDVVQAEADAQNAPLLLRDRDWELTRSEDGASLLYKDAKGVLTLPLPALTGAHQDDNAGLAVATLRASGLDLPDSAWAGIAHTRWPARLQKLEGALAAQLPSGWELWLDGGHNPGAGEALVPVLEHWSDRPLHILVGMKQTKDASGFLSPLLDHATSVHAVAEPDQHLALPVEAIVEASRGRAQPGPDIATALTRLSGRPEKTARVLICGSLYLAGVVLKKDGWHAE